MANESFQPRGSCGVHTLRTHIEAMKTPRRKKWIVRYKTIENHARLPGVAINSTRYLCIVCICAISKERRAVNIIYNKIVDST